MKKFLTLGAMLLSLAGFTIQNAAASPLEFVNAGIVDQYNGAAYVEEFSQLNVTVLYQTIQVGPYFVTDPIYQTPLVDNIVLGHQDDICVECYEMYQNNYLEFVQVIDPPGFLNPGAPHGGYAPFNLAINLHDGEQINLGEFAAGVDEFNFEEVYQDLAYNVPTALHPGQLLSLTNYLEFWQVNECYYCASGSQENILLVHQTIKPIPEPATMMLMGSGLIGLVAWRLRKGRATTNA